MKQAALCLLAFCLMYSAIASVSGPLESVAQNQRPQYPKDDSLKNQRPPEIKSTSSQRGGTKQSQRGASEPTHNPSQDCCPAESQFGPGFWQAVFSGMLVIVTIVQSVFLWRTIQETKRAANATDMSAKAAMETAKVADASLTQLQRAFVHMKGFAAVRVPIESAIYWHFFPEWENSGATPTRDLSVWIRSEYCPPGTNIIEGFQFARAHSQKLMLAPKAIVRPEPERILSDQLAYTAPGETGHLYIYGGCEYRDIFGESLHHTRFCYEVATTSEDIDSALNSDQAEFVYRLHKEHNDGD